MNKLPPEFYRRSSYIVAKELLGKKLVRNVGSVKAVGRIVEVEAYGGSDDPASHAWRGKSSRNEAMFRSGGCLYVYFIYGMYYCCNIVTGPVGVGEAILIRGIEPLEGTEWMSLNRYNHSSPSAKEKINLTNGPGKICSAFNITSADNGADLCGDSIFVSDTDELRNPVIESSGRIGISRASDFPWRFFIKSNPYVSKTSARKS